MVEESTLFIWKETGKVLLRSIDGVVLDYQVGQKVALDEHLAIPSGIYVVIDTLRRIKTDDAGTLTHHVAEYDIKKYSRLSELELL